MKAHIFASPRGKGRANRKINTPALP